MGVRCRKRSQLLLSNMFRRALLSAFARRFRQQEASRASGQGQEHFSRVGCHSHAILDALQQPQIGFGSPVQCTPPQLLARSESVFATLSGNKRSPAEHGFLCAHAQRRLHHRQGEETSHGSVELCRSSQPPRRWMPFRADESKTVRSRSRRKFAAQRQLRAAVSQWQLFTQDFDCSSRHRSRTSLQDTGSRKTCPTLSW